MECTIAALIACFSWSGLYVDGGLQFNDYDTLRPGYTDAVTIETPSVIETISYQTSIAERGNPQGRIALGYEVGFRRLSFRLEASHMSSFATESDRGLNAIGISARWYPFR